VDEFEQRRALIIRDFNLEIPGMGLDEKALFEVLCNEVAYMIDKKLDFLLSLLYRLDVLEPDINHALSPFCLDPANVALAKLIMKRQKERISTQNEYREKFPPNEDLGDLSFDPS